MVVGDRPRGPARALDFLARAWTWSSRRGGLGPTADDLTAEVVAAFAGRPTGARRGARGADLGDLSRAARPLARRRARRRCAPATASRRWCRAARRCWSRSAPRRAWSCRSPAGRSCRAARAAAASCSRCGRRRVAVAAGAGRAARARALRAADHADTGVPESEIAETLREVDARARRLEITTCLRRGELEIATVFDPAAAADVRGVRGGACSSATATRVFSRDGATIDEIVAGLLLGPPVRTVAVAESCTGGLMAARLTDRAGSSAYVLGGVVAYSNEAKVAHAGVPAALIERARRGVAGGGGARWRRAPPRGSAPTSGSASPASPGRAAARRRSRSARSACAWRAPTARR